MKRYCKKCGALLNDGAVFCARCGYRAESNTRPAQPAQRQTHQPQQPMPQQTRQPQQPMPQQTRQPVNPPQAYRQSQQTAPPKPAKQPKPKKKAQTSTKKRSRIVAVVIASIAVVLIGAFVVTAFFAPGFLVKPQKNQNTVTTSSENALAMLEYTRQLEDSGNHDAAAQIYSMLPDAVKEGAAEEGKKVVDDSTEKEIIDGPGRARDILNDINKITEE